MAGDDWGRRSFVGAVLAGAAMPWLADCGLAGQAGRTGRVAVVQEQEWLARQADAQRQLALLEQQWGGRLGVAALNVGQGRELLQRGNERFAMCSTFKLVLVLVLMGAVLAGSVHDDGLLAQRFFFSEQDLVAYSPVSSGFAGSAGSAGMTVEQLCIAALRHSDNTAANLLMRLLGGPQAVKGFARSLGDEAFRLECWETELNSAIPGDERDTTTPWATAQTVRKLVLGGGGVDVLAAPQRALLQEWLKGNRTGDKRFRAGVPEGWVVADKTGSGAYGVTNDVGVLWRPEGEQRRGPMVLAVYFSRPVEDASYADEIVAQALG